MPKTVSRKCVDCGLRIAVPRKLLKDIERDQVIRIDYNFLRHKCALRKYKCDTCYHDMAPEVKSNCEHCKGTFEIDIKNLMHRKLPKWPALIVTGKPITKDQARDVIRVTDDTFVYANGDLDSASYSLMANRLIIPLRPQWVYDSLLLSRDSRFERQLRMEEYEAQAIWSYQWGSLKIGELRNHIISYGYGWCRPNGYIGLIDNIGKWPKIRSIYEDLISIASTFPYLSMGVTIMSASRTEGGSPVVSMRVKEGTVTLVDPEDEDVHSGHEWPGGNVEASYDEPYNQKNFPNEWLEEWSKIAQDRITVRLTT